MENFEKFLANGQISFREELYNVMALIDDLIWKEIPFSVRYEDKNTVVITDLRDDGK